MNSLIDSSFELIDHKTCRSICDAVGERLQQDLRPIKSELPPYLAHLMNELRERDRSGITASNQRISSSRSDPVDVGRQFVDALRLCVPREHEAGAAADERIELPAPIPQRL